MCCQAICGPEERNAQRAALSSTHLTLNMWCCARGYSSGLRAEWLWVLNLGSGNEPNIGQLLKSKSGFTNTVHEQMAFNKWPTLVQRHSVTFSELNLGVKYDCYLSCSLRWPVRRPHDAYCVLKWIELVISTRSLLIGSPLRNI